MTRSATCGGSPNGSSTVPTDTVDPAQLLWGVLFGSVGFGYFLYGKKQQVPVPLVCGLLLMVVPYFIADTVWLVGTCLVLSVVPYFAR